MMNARRAALVALCAWACAAAAQPDAPAPERAPPVRPYTSSRLDQDAMRLLLEPLLPAIEAGDIVEAERRFARLLAAETERLGGTSLAAPDLQAAFGVTLFNMTRGPGLRLRGIAYLRRAADAYAGRLGRDHPEVALTFSDIGNAHLVLAPDDPPQEAEEAIAEAHRIRLATLGAHNVETASSLARLAGIRGLPSRTGGDPARIEASAAMYRQAIADFGDLLVVPSGHGAVTTLFDLAAMYAANGRNREALAAALEGHEAYRRRFSGHVQLCNLIRGQSRRLGLELLAQGGERAGRRLERSERRTARFCTVPALTIPSRARARSRPS